MGDGSERCDRKGAASADRIETSSDPIGALEAFSCEVRSAADRRRCGELATVVAAWIARRRAEAVASEAAATPLDDETCFSRFQRERDRRTSRRDGAAAEEIVATLRSLSAGRSSLDADLLRRMVREFVNMVRDAGE